MKSTKRVGSVDSWKKSEKRKSSNLDTDDKIHVDVPDFDSCETSSSSSVESMPGHVGSEVFSIDSSQRCSTLSTLAHTHSSAMEGLGDHEVRPMDDALSDLDSSKSNYGDFLDTDHYTLSSLSSIGDCSTSTSGHMDSNVDDDDDDDLMLESTSKSCSKPSQTFGHFTSKLVKILRRVEELDLLQLSSIVHSQLVAKVDRLTHPTESDSDVDDLVDFDLDMYDSVQLTKFDVMMFCLESEEIRASGSMFTIPTGRLVRFLTLLLVNMHKAAYICPDLSKLVSLMFYINKLIYSIEKVFR